MIKHTWNIDGDVEEVLGVAKNSLLSCFIKFSNLHHIRGLKQYAPYFQHFNPVLVIDYF